ncbi:tetratricopeptide repeat protein, partial [Acinetobacter baumannii]
KGVELNNKKAFELYSKAAEQGNEKAQNNLGAIYALGIGVNQDYKKAFEWY